MRSVDKAVKRGFAHRVGRREADAKMPTNNNTINDLILGGNHTGFNKTIPKELLAARNLAAFNVTILNA